MGFSKTVKCFQVSQNRRRGDYFWVAEEILVSLEEMFSRKLVMLQWKAIHLQLRRTNKRHNLYK
jgi:hypothetical protein